MKTDQTAPEKYRAGNQYSGRLPGARIVELISAEKTPHSRLG